MPPTECPGCGGELPTGLYLCADCSGRLRKGPPNADAMLGQAILGKYVIETLVAEGGMGRVYRGRHRELKRVVAVKVIQPGLSSVAQVRERFFLEAKALSSLTDPHSVSIVDFGEHTTGELCIVMQFVSGEDLANIIARDGPLPARRAVTLALQVLGSLAEAHSLGILHRDLKPENVIVQKLQDNSDFAVVLDFGIARVTEAPGAARATLAGAVMGTPRYMSPEQALSQPVVPASDIYSLGVVLYEMLTQARPCDAEEIAAIFVFHAQGKAAPVAGRAGYTGDAALAAIVDRMVARAPTDRYSSALAAMQALREWLTGNVARAVTCTACGAALEATARFCAHCGASRANVLTTIRPPPPADAPRSLPEAPRPPAAPAARPDPKPAARSEARESAKPLVRPAPSLPPLPASDPPPRTRRRWGRRPDEMAFTGRDAPFAALTKLCTTPGRLRVAITGAPGMGKRRLLDELLHLLASRGKNAVVVEPDPEGRTRLGGALRRLIQGVLNLDDLRSIDALRAAGQSAGLLEPDVAGLAFLCGIATATDGPRVDDTTESIRALAKAAARMERAILCSDFDQLDAMSRRAIEAIIEAGGDDLAVGITIVCPPPGEWSIVAVGPLPAEAASHFAAAALRDARNPAAVARVTAMGKGVPLALVEAAALVLDGDTTSAPETLADILAARIGRLGLETVRALHRIAVVGEASADTSLGASELALLAARGFIVNRAGSYRFPHPEIQRLVYGMTPNEVRRRLHADAAERAERDRELGAWGAATHMARAGNAKQAVGGWLAAAMEARTVGDFAVEGFALREALSHLRLAERLDEVTQAAYVEKFADLSMLLASAAVGGGDTLGAASLIREALQIKPSAATAARLWLRLAEIQAAGGDRGEAALSADRADAARKRGVDVVFDARLAVLMAELMLKEFGLAEAIQRFADTLGTPSPDPITERWDLALRLGKLYLDAGDVHTALAYHELALGAASRTGDEIGRASAYAALMRVHQQSGEFELARRTGESAVEILSRVGDRRRTRDTLMELRQIAKVADRTGAFKLEVDRRARNLATALGFVWMPDSGGIARVNLK